MPKPISLPAVSPDFESGTIAKWHVAEGDVIAAGDVLVDVETDKAVVEVEAQDSGVLGKIAVNAGTDDVAVNTILGFLLEEGETVDDLVDIVLEDSSQESAPASPLAEPLKPATTSTRESDFTQERIFASPLARRIAKQKGISLEGIRGRGPNGRILKADLEGLASAVNSSGTSLFSAATHRTDNSTEIPLSNMRKTIARRLSESKQTIPHFTLSVDIELDALLQMRADINAEARDGNFKLSVNDFVIKASALALIDVPAVNTSWTDNTILQHHNADISVAVATPSGLITPIIFDADKKSIFQISEESTALAEKARAGRLKPAEFQGGTFSISNLGMFGTKQFTAIINPPQSCILAVGAGIQQPVVKDGELAVATVLTATLSSDHRTVDGAIAAEFMQSLKNHLERPMALLLNNLA